MNRGISGNNNEQVTTASDVLKKALSETKALIQAASDQDKLFPNGIDQIKLGVKVSGVELDLEISGPAGAEIAGPTLLLTKRASISFGPNAEGALTFGSTSVPCLGNSQVNYTRDLTVTGTVNVDKFPRKYSNEFGVWMNFAVLIMGDRGIYIHEGADSLATNGGETAGCIHLAPGNAQAFYDWVDGRTRITIAYPW